MHQNALVSAEQCDIMDHSAGWSASSAVWSGVLSSPCIVPPRARGAALHALSAASALCPLPSSSSTDANWMLLTTIAAEIKRQTDKGKQPRINVGGKLIGVIDVVVVEEAQLVQFPTVENGTIAFMAAQAQNVLADLIRATRADLQ